jgi:Fe-S cluster assembly iron-binding protein IscA
MIEVTERAKQELKHLLTTTVDNPLAGLRLVTNEQGQIGLGVDVEMPDDKVVEHDGSKVLLVKEELANKLESLTLDVEDAPEGARLVIGRNSSE